MKLGVTSYVILSLIAEACMIYYAYYTQRQFYPTVLFLVSSKVSVVLAGNLCLALTLVLAKIVQYSFFGTLRTIELELLMEKAKYAFIETCLALTIFRQELTGPVIALFGFLIFIKLLHKLAKMRQDYLEQIADVSLYMQIRMSCLLSFLLLVDCLVVMYTIQNFMAKGRSVLMLFGFEFGLLVNYALNLMIKFVLQSIDARMENGLRSRGFLVMVADLGCEIIKVVTYVIFFALVFSNYGLPIHLVRDVYAAYHSFHRKLIGFMKYLQVTQNLENRFADATEEECTAAGNCLVCREEMTRGKKLPCGHVFHLDCLRMWLQHQQSCPLCRAEIVIPGEGAAVPAVNPPVVAAAPAAAPAGNVPPVAAPPVNAVPAVAAPALANNPVLAPAPAVNHGNNANIVARAPVNAAPVVAPPVPSSSSSSVSTKPTLAADIMRKVASYSDKKLIYEKSPSLYKRNSKGNKSSALKESFPVKESFPAYYVVVSDGPVSVYNSPFIQNNNNSDGSNDNHCVQRHLASGTIVFVKGRLQSSASLQEEKSWLRIADGWVRERDEHNVTTLLPFTGSANSDKVCPDTEEEESEEEQIVRKRSKKLKKTRKGVDVSDSDDNDGLVELSDKRIENVSGNELLALQQQLLTMTRNMEKMQLSLLSCQDALSKLVRSKVESEAQENIKLLGTLSLSTPQASAETVEDEETTAGVFVKEEVVRAEQS